MHYDGKLVVGINTRRYVGGKVAFFDWVDTDYMGMIELKDMVKELNLFGSMTYHYKVPARDLYHGFRHLEDDSDCIEMVKWVKLSKTIEVYIENHCNFSNENQHLSTAVVIEEEDGDEDWDGDGDGDVNQGDGDEDYTHSGDDTTDLDEFVDSEADESEDDRLFDIHVDKNVEWGGLSMGKGKEPMSTKTNDNEDSDAEGQSDELVSLYGSSDEEAREEHDQFNPNTDMADPKFKVGMIFSTSKLFKDAVKEHAIKTAKAIKLVKNDSRRVRAACKKPCQWSLLASKMQGRPKKLRKRGLDEPQTGTKLKRRNTTTTCAQCGMLGHNKRTCKGQPITQKQGTTREKIPVRKKKSTATRVQESASQPTIGTTRTNASQPDMRTSGSQPQAAMGTTRELNMRAQPQAATRTVPHPNSSLPFGGVMAKGKKSIKLSTLQQTSTKRA
ncbi:hypothetical protein C3L33_06323, partial [Rhododendron williamsianum]